MSNRLLLNVAFPVVKRLVSRNNVSLMEQDLDMRRRRGDLRRRDYAFERIGNGAYAYLPTMRIADDHVTPPPPPETEPVRIALDALPTETLQHVGDDAAYGVQLRKADGRVEVYPRLCPHEGACLDASAPKAERVHCPWHGRAFKAEFLPMTEGASVSVGGMTVRVEGGEVVATPRAFANMDDFDVPRHPFVEQAESV
jgi:nitrite reductase/ring-hydroxylating ferredoxin subunit